MGEVQFSRSVVSDSATPWPACPPPTPRAYSYSCPSLWWCHLIFCHPFVLPPSIFPSIRVFSNELVLRIRWPENWSFSFCTSPFNEYSGLISFRIDWFDLLAVQHHSSKASSDLSALGLLPPLWSGHNTYLVRLLCELRKLNLKFLV